MLNLIRHIDSVNGRRIILKMHHTIKRDYRIFRVRERTGFAGPKRVTTVEVPLQRIFMAPVVPNSPTQYIGESTIKIRV